MLFRLTFSSYPVAFSMSDSLRHLRTFAVTQADRVFSSLFLALVLSLSPSLHQDMCVVCGSFGKGVEGQLLACAQCAQCYHPYCVNSKVSIQPLYSLELLFKQTP